MKKEFFTFDERIKEASKKALAKASVMFDEIEEITEYN